ncbi:hypothetical protein OPU71_17025 [Niveibacterium sp. 24ML]|uniref:hypothetical protein n=1 Tax=Niveibacterium sp. 24ML TaxID=2985512 RepID=UPI002271A20F|nr:hypothetical protein [Niveibacterium sp. 24ML]MCX9157829.1 hypothetical protein [Niveibacterium sp. 24ML]
MTPELESRLYAAYPSLFHRETWIDTESAMQRGCCCGDGWFAILDALCECIAWSVEHENMPPVEVRQIKEKFGSLRFRYSGGDDRTRALVVLAQALSVRVDEDASFNERAATRYVDLRD